MISSGSLAIVNVKPSDSGKYMCAASNTPLTYNWSGVNDSRAAAIRLVVYSPSAHLMIVATGTDYVSITWVGIEPTITSGSATYVVVYRPLPIDESMKNKDSQIDKLTLKNDGDHNDDAKDNDYGYYDDTVDGGNDGKQREINRLPQNISQRAATWCIAETARQGQGECLRGVNVTDSRSLSRQLTYRKAVDVRPYMRGYWIGALMSGTRYEFCVGIFRLEYEDQLADSGRSSSLSTVQLVNCTPVVTTSKNSRNRHLIGSQMFVDDLDESDVVVVAVTGCVFAVVCLLPGLIGLLGALVRRHRRRMEYVDPLSQPHNGLSYHQCDVGVESEFRVGEFDATSVTFNIDSTSASIPLDDLYRGPSSQLVTSRTSLIG